MKKILLCSMLFARSISAGEAFSDPGLDLNDLPPQAASSSSNQQWETPFEEVEFPDSLRSKFAGARIYITQVPSHQHHTHGTQTVDHKKAPIAETFVDTATQTVANTLFSLLTRDGYAAVKSYLCPSEEDKLNLEFNRFKLRQAQNNEAEREMSNNIVSRLVTVTALINTLRAEASRCDGNLSPAKKVELDSLVQERALLQALITPKQ